MDISVRLTFRQKAELVNALLECATVRDRATRDAEVNDLRPNLRDSIPRSPVDRVDVSNIVTRCLDYPGGITELIEIVRFYEGDSLGMRQVDEVMQRLWTTRQ